MLDRLFPTKVENSFDGYKIAQWVLYFFVIKSFVAACIHMFAVDGGAMSIASISLDQFSQGAADTIVTIFGLWGLEQLVIGLIATIVLWRYRTLIPMMWLAYVIEYGLRILSHFFTPGIVSSNTPPGIVMDNILLPISILMLVIALIKPKAKN